MRRWGYQDSFLSVPSLFEESDVSLIRQQGLRRRADLSETNTKEGLSSGREGRRQFII